MKKFLKSCLTAFAAAAVFLSVFSLNVSASYDPETKADMITYRNFFGTKRDIEVNGKTITAEEFPVVTFVNEGARDQDYHSEANYNGGIFLFSNAVIEKDSNVVALFYDYDQRHADVRSCEYYIYAAAPGTDIKDAMTNDNNIAVLSYDKDEQIWDEVATDTWHDFYGEDNAGPMTSKIDLKAGTYDIYVLVQMIDVDDTFEDDNLKDISAKLAEIDFMNDPNAAADPTEAPATETPAATEKPETEKPASTEPAPTETVADKTNTPAGENPGESDSENTTWVIIVIAAVVVIVIIGGVIYAVKKKK